MAASGSKPSGEIEVPTPTGLPSRFAKRTGYFDLRDRRGTETPTSPRTPLGRSYSSNFSTPGSGLRPDDDFFVFEFTTRFLKGGIAGESLPRCRLDFSPAKRKKLGDYTQSPLGAQSHTLPSASSNDENWGSDHVLWDMDVRKVDLGLMNDLMERGLRDAILNHILVLDGKRRKYVLALPPALPDPIVETLLLTVFNTYPPPTTVTILPSPVLCAIAAGVRSALVVDIGWDSTTVSVIYEYCQIACNRTIRGMKMLSWQVRKTLIGALKGTKEARNSRDTDITFQDVEEVLARMTWCRKSRNDEAFSDRSVHLELSTISLETNFSALAEPVEQVFLGPSFNNDDNEKSVPRLVFEALLTLSTDVRQACISRIIITGEGGEIPGLRRRLLIELHDLIQDRGWYSVNNHGLLTMRRRTPEEERIRLIAMDAAKRAAAEGSTTVQKESQPLMHTNKDVDVHTTTPAHLQPPLSDAPILQHLRSRTAPQLSAFQEGTPEFTPSHDRVCGIRTAGAWAGASLLAGLHIPGVIEIERERFLRGGLAGWEAFVKDEQERLAERKSTLKGARRTTSGMRNVSGLGGG